MTNAADSRFVAGDFWTWRRDDLAAAWPPAEFALYYAIRPEAGGAAPEHFAAVESSGGWLVEVASPATALFAPGRWRLAIFATRAADGARFTVEQGDIEIAPDPAAAETDGRSADRRILDAITARLEGRITKDAESYTIEGRSIARTPLDVLHKLRTQYARRVAREDGRGGVRWSRAVLR